MNKKEQIMEYERLKALDKQKAQVDELVGSDKHLDANTFYMIDYETRIATLNYYGKVVALLARDYYSAPLIYADPAVFQASDNYKRYMSDMTWFHKSCFSMEAKGLARDPIDASRFEIGKGQIDQQSVNAIIAAYEYNPEQTANNEPNPNNDLIE